MKLLLTATLFAATAVSQPTVAPTDARVGFPRGDDVEAYNIRQSFEVGVRAHTVGGDEGLYRSTVNFGNGVRLLGSSLSINSLEGHGHYFDLIQLNTQGLGNDPYQYANFRIEKNRLYRYDLNWRSNAYYNPGLRVAGGQHAIDTVRNMQDHDLTFLPQSKTIKFFVGFSRNTQSGPALSTVQLFDSRGDEFPLFTDVRRQQHEYRAGFEMALLGWRLNLLHGWVNFKDDTPATGLFSTLGSTPANNPGNNPDDLTELASFRRSEPYHGRSPYWRIALFKETPLWAFNGRFTYVTGQRSFVQDETAVGLNRLGADTSRQIVTLGDARRPSATGNVTFSLFPHDRVTLVNQTSVYNIRMVGNSYYTQLTNGVPITPFSAFSYLGIRTIANATDLDVRLARWLGLRAGYQYSTRRIRSREDFGDNAPIIEQDNALHTGLLGLRFQPVRPLTIRLDAEIGRADRPIYTVSQRRFQAFRGRIEWKRDRYRLAAFARTDYNTNSASLANFASRSKQYGADASWTLSNGFFIDASYAKLDLDTLGAINYFAAQGSLTSLQSGHSTYVSRMHTASLAARFVVRRLDVSLGFSHVQDTASVPFYLAAGPVVPTNQAFPVRFTSPQGRVSYRINDNLRWNLGYQHYGYAEGISGAYASFLFDPTLNTVNGVTLGVPFSSFSLSFNPRQSFRAHTGFTSILWSF